MTAEGDTLDGIRARGALPVVTPVVASSLLWSLIYQQNGIFNTVLGWFGIGPVPWLSSTSPARPISRTRCTTRRRSTERGRSASSSR